MPAPKAQDNFTDPDSRIMKTSAGFEQCFNAQTAVDAHTQIVVAAELTNGWIKHILGFRQFSFRGIEKVRCEFKLVCAALNLRRMARMMA